MGGAEEGMGREEGREERGREGGVRKQDEAARGGGDREIILKSENPTAL